MFAYLRNGKIVAIDPNGNTTSKTKAGVTTTFLYNIRDQMSEVRQDASTLGRYGYDYDRRRILKIGEDGLRRYSYDQLSVLTEADVANATVSKYDYGQDHLVSLDNTSEGRSFFHLDILRSTANLTDEFGATRQSILYDAWGNEHDRLGLTANKFTFTGRRRTKKSVSSPQRLDSIARFVRVSGAIPKKKLSSSHLPEDDSVEAWFVLSSGPTKRRPGSPIRPIATHCGMPVPPTCSKEGLISGTSSNSLVTEVLRKVYWDNAVAAYGLDP